MKNTLIALALVLPGSLAAQSCPEVEDKSSQMATLFTLLNRAQSDLQASPVEAALWDLWTDAPDAAAQALLDEGRDRLAARDFAGARTALDALVAYCPAYAEGYNQRAFVAYLSGDFAAALVDLDRALALEPLHVAALSGRALTLLGLGRDDEGQRTLRRALKLNPWLDERALLKPIRGDTF
ncbi:hypothetical protein ILP92_14500 [Maribius pontilimi]|uniref:Tetratricopeptide repeat-containing protein n=1 Tax=Palleronia pontilimi TaxID=1964209 RepID=A0A934IIG2_9RHOB|nr:tetratricopeptide repeat protein [Palleronia pontilimi]MBJ3763960.1 hypothetical protein [Palleronia pontilimi]